MAIEVTPLGFQKPDGNELVRQGDNVIAHNAQRSQDIIGKARADIVNLQNAAGFPGDPLEMQDTVVSELIGVGGTLTGAALNAAIGDQTQAAITRAPLAAFTARTAERDTTPVIVAFVGSSSIGGAGASPANRGFTHLLANSLQATFPLLDGSASPATVTLATAVASPPASPGVQMVYKSIGGSTSATYLSSTDRTDIGALAPALVLHLLGANDGRNSITPATFKANLEVQISGIASASTLPVTQILVCQPPQSDAGWAPTYEYGLYQDAMKQIAIESNGSVLFINTNPEFASIGIIGGITTDPLGVVYSDDIHPSNAGHALLADIVRRALSWTTPSATPSAAASYPQPSSFFRVWSDSFTTDGDVSGRATDSFQGGTGGTWVASAATRFFTVSGTLRPHTVSTNGACGVSIPAGDVQVSTLVDTSPTDGALILSINMQNSAGDSTTDHARFAYSPSTGILSLQKRYGGNTFTIDSSAVSAGYLTGKIMTLRRYRGAFYAIIDGVVIFTAPTDGVADGGTAGLFRAGGTSGTAHVAWMIADALV